MSNTKAKATTLPTVMGWTHERLHQWVDRQQVPAHYRLVLHRMVRFTNQTTRRGRFALACWPSHQRLADDVHIRRNSVRRIISNLIKAGLIEVDPSLDLRKKYGGRPNSNCYVLCPGGPPKAPLVDLVTALDQQRKHNAKLMGSLNDAAVAQAPEKQGHSNGSAGDLMGSLRSPELNKKTSRQQAPEAIAKGSAAGRLCGGQAQPPNQTGEYSTDHRSAPRPRPSPFVSTSGGCGPGAQVDEAKRDRRVRDRQQAAKKNRDLFMHAIPGDAVDTVFGRVDIGEAEAYNRAVARIGRLSARIRADHGLA